MSNSVKLWVSVLACGSLADSTWIFQTRLSGLCRLRVKIRERDPRDKKKKKLNHDLDSICALWADAIVLSQVALSARQIF